MADFKNLTLTTFGSVLLEKAIAGTTLEFTRAAIGDGRVADGTDISGLTALVNEKKSIPINSIEFKDGLATVTIAFSNSDLSVGFHVRELGLFAKDPEKGEILYAIANAGDDADWLPEMGSNVVEEVFKIVPVVSGATKVTAVIDNSLTYVTKEEFKAHHHVAGGQNDGEQVDAKDVVNAPRGSITATDVQLAIDELNEQSKVWQPSTAYRVGDICYFRSNSYIMLECVAAGITGINEPSLFTVGTNLTDNGVTWMVYDTRNISPAIGGYENLIIKVTANDCLTITADALSLHNASYTRSKTLSNVSLSLSTAFAGVNGLDTGSIAASTWYAVYVIYNPLTNRVAGLLSINYTSPTLPDGYTMYRRWGWVLTNSNNYLYRTIQYGNEASYIVDGMILTALRKICSGIAGTLQAGSSGTTTFVAVNVSNFIPYPTSSKIKFVGANITGSVIVLAPNSNYGGYENTTNPPPFSLNTEEDNDTAVQGEFLLESSYVYYASGASTGAIFVSGWTDNL